VNNPAFYQGLLTGVILGFFMGLFAALLAVLRPGSATLSSIAQPPPVPAKKKKEV